MHRLFLPIALVVTSPFVALPVHGQAVAETRPPDRDSQPPNIVVILADDLGYQDVGAYGQSQIQTPSLDRMAREGARFTQFYAGSAVCRPSRCALMTGLHTGHCYLRENRATLDLRPDDFIVAEMLRSAGYTTGMIGKWSLGEEGTTGTPRNQGYDYFFGYLNQTHAHNYYPQFMIRNEDRVPLPNIVPNQGLNGEGVATTKVQYSHDLITEEALDFIERNRDEPFFLYLAYTIPHANSEAGDRGMEVPDYGPYESRAWPEPQKGYAAMVSRLDTDVGRLLDHLTKNGLDTNTVVFFTSDNGPHDSGGVDPEFFESSGPLRGIKGELYEGGIRVPLIVRWPGRIPAGSVSDHVGYFPDFLPTAGELAGVHSEKRTDGISLVPTLTGDHARQETHEYLYWEVWRRGGMSAVRMGDWKAVRSPSWAELELYNLHDDIAEAHDVAAEHPMIVQTLDAMIRSSHEPYSLQGVIASASLRTWAMYVSMLFMSLSDGTVVALIVTVTGALLMSLYLVRRKILHSRAAKTA